MLHAAFPDLEARLEVGLAEGDQVAGYSVWRAAHGTGKPVDQLEIMRIQGGRIAEHWGNASVMDLLQMDLSQAKPAEPER